MTQHIDTKYKFLHLVSVYSRGNAAVVREDLFHTTVHNLGESGYIEEHQLPVFLDSETIIEISDQNVCLYLFIYLYKNTLVIS